MKYPEYKEVLINGRVRVCLEKVLAQDMVGKTLVDVGCSYGWLAYVMSDQGLKKFVGVDPSATAIEFARKKNRAADFRVGRAERLPLKDETADVVVMFDVIEHVAKWAETAALSEAYRVLKPGGVLLLSTPNYHWLMNMFDPVWYWGHRHYRAETLKNVLEKIGYKKVKMEVRGGVWFSWYLWWLYAAKRILRRPMPRNRFLEKKDDEQFNVLGVHTIFCEARKS